MDLKTFFFGLPNTERTAFAERCKSTKGHVQNVAYGYRVASAELAVAIEQQSGRQVTRQEMFPQSYQSIWPELGALEPATQTEG